MCKSPDLTWSSTAHNAVYLTVGRFCRNAIYQVIIGLQRGCDNQPAYQLIRTSLSLGRRINSSLLNVLPELLPILIP
jgi:hypothetical protein